MYPNDLKRLLRSLFQNNVLFEAHNENLNEDKRMLSVAKCIPMTLGSGNIRFMPVRWKGASNESGVVDNGYF